MNTILVPTDFSETAENAMNYAALLARQLDSSRLILYHSYARPVSTYGKPNSVKIRPDFEADSEQRLDESKEYLRSLLPAEVDVVVHSDNSSLIAGIMSEIKGRKVDVVVMGIRRRSGAGEYLEESDALSLSTRCSCPLLLVPPQVGYKPIGKIALVVDIAASHLESPVSLLKGFLKATDAKLLVLHAAYNGKQLNSVTNKYDEQLHALLDEHEPEFVQLKKINAEEGIRHFVADQDIDIVATIPHSFGFFENLLHPDATPLLANHLDVPLLVLREPNK